MIANYKSLSKRDYLEKYLSILDCMQIDDTKRMAKSEKEFLIEILMLPKKYDYFRFSSQSKKFIMDKLEKETEVKHSYQNLNNKIYKLIKKGYLWKDADSQIYFKPYILKALKELESALEAGKHYDFTFRFKA